MKKFFSIIFLSLNIFCAEQSAAEWKYFKLIGGYEKYIGIIVIVHREDIQSDVYQCIEYPDVSTKRYLNLEPKPPKVGKIYMGALSAYQQSYLFHESWLQKVDQKEGYVKYCAQGLQQKYLYKYKKYAKIIRGYPNLENKIAMVREFDFDKESIDETLLRKYRLFSPHDKGKVFIGKVSPTKEYFFHETWLENVDEQNAKEQFGKQLEEEILSNPDYFK